MLKIDGSYEKKINSKKKYMRKGMKNVKNNTKNVRYFCTYISSIF